MSIPLPTLLALSGTPIDTDITGIAHDSRKVEPGFLFVAIKGFSSDGHTYIKAAIEQGARAVVYNKEFDIGPIRNQAPDVFFHATENPRRMLADIAARFYGEPTKQLTVLGVTGTNGKTTTTYLIKHLLEHLGAKSGLLGTIQNMIGDEVIKTSLTTPESLELQALFSRMIESGASHAVMEASSHALYLHRCDNIHFDGIVFTNITEDHLDFHHTMENYLFAKLIAFELLSRSVKQQKHVFLNIHTERFDAIREKAQSLGVPVITYGFDADADYRADITSLTRTGTIFTLYHAGKGIGEVALSLIGSFNVLNALAAIAYAHSLGHPFDSIIPALTDVQVPGRFEIVTPAEAPFTVAVDYAHTDDALVNLLSAARAIKPARVITVFGCGGDRDRKKRPLMGKAAGTYSEYVVLTSDNPRTEDPAAIINDAKPGLDETGTEYTIIVNRREAIEHAIRYANDDDLVLIAGKGHEDYQILGTERIHFDDREVARECLSKR